MKIKNAFLFSFLFLYHCSYSQTTSVKIGTQEWATANLNVTTFRNGDTIPEAESKEEWEKASNEGKPAWCYYNGKASNGKKYGKLYNGYAVTDVRSLAPAGWHLAPVYEWITLINFLGGENAAGYKMKNISGWEDNGNGDNHSHFSALPGGFRLNDGTYDEVGKSGYFWPFDLENNMTSMVYNLYSSGSGIIHIKYHKGCGFSCRCMKD